MMMSLSLKWLLGLFPLFFVSCVKEAKEPDEEASRQETLGPKWELTITPALPRLSLETKVGLVPAFAFCWTGDESMSLLFSQEGEVQKRQFSGQVAIHPDANGMAFMSRKIYTELGTWLEE